VYLRFRLRMLALVVLALWPACMPLSHTPNPTRELAAATLSVGPSALSADPNVPAAQTPTHAVPPTAGAVSVARTPTVRPEATAVLPAAAVTTVIPLRTPLPSRTISPSPTATSTVQSQALRPCQDEAAGYDAQLADLASFIGDHGLPSRVTQVDLATHAKVSQYRPEITRQYGFDACGLVAAAAALQPGDWVSLVGKIRAASGDAYGPRTGIQPSPYVLALRRVFPDKQVLEENQWSLCGLYEAIRGQEVVIVDIQVGSAQNRQAEVPTARPPNYSHFARVLGLDVTAGKVFVENTLRGSSSYWELSLRRFWDVWLYPETSVSIRAPFPEEVTRWGVLID